MTLRSGKAILTPLFLLAVFVIVDRLLVQPNVAAHDRAKAAYRAAKEEHERAVFQTDRAEFLAGAGPDAAAGPDAILFNGGFFNPAICRDRRSIPAWVSNGLPRCYRAFTIIMTPIRSRH